MYDICHALYVLEQTTLSGQVSGSHNSLRHLESDLIDSLYIVIIPTFPSLSSLLIALSPTLMKGLAHGTGRHKKNQRKYLMRHLFQKHGSQSGSIRATQSIVYTQYKTVRVLPQKSSQTHLADTQHTLFTFISSSSIYVFNVHQH